MPGGGLAVLGGAARPVGGEQRAGGAGFAAGRAVAPPEQHGDDRDDDDQHGQGGAVAAAERGAGAVEQLVEPVLEPGQEAVDQAGFVLVVDGLAEFFVRGVAGGVARHGHRDAVREQRPSPPESHGRQAPGGVYWPGTGAAGAGA